MTAWRILGRKSQTQQKVINGRFEIERDGKTAYLEYTLTGNILGLIHTEVPPELRHMGLASSLAETGFRWARENNYRVDIVCPSVEEYLAHHPEYQDLVMR
jgi:uncharacterized protein